MEIMEKDVLGGSGALARGNGNGNLKDFTLVNSHAFCVIL
jgi:hypothetical protein